MKSRFGEAKKGAEAPSLEGSPFGQGDHVAACDDQVVEHQTHREVALGGFDNYFRSTTSTGWIDSESFVPESLNPAAVRAYRASIFCMDGLRNA